MIIKLVGNDNKGLEVVAYIKEDNIKDVCKEIRESMGIVAYNDEEFKQELKAIGFTIAAAEEMDQVEETINNIPINLLDIEELF